MDLISVFSSFGIFGLSGVLFLETAILPLFFLPGDTLLFTSGYLIHAGNLPIHHAFIVLSIGAFLGNIGGYYMGVFAEKPLMRFSKKEGSTFNKGLERTRKFYKKYGILTLIFARFIPSVRTIAPFLAGVLRIKIKQFIWVSFLSSILWVSTGLLLGFFFGRAIPNLEHIMVAIMIIAVSAAMLPILWMLIKNTIKKRFK